MISTLAIGILIGTIMVFVSMLLALIITAIEYKLKEYLCEKQKRKEWGK